jgi:HD-like signal output (HDOD) protein/CheY-like chemotaxis protein
VNKKEKMMKSILFVDDDPEILSSTRRLLSSTRQKWNVAYANSGEEALNKMRGNFFDVLITDIRMPGMSGIELLTITQKEYPETIRIALSGYSDRDASLLASGLAHQYLAKPTPIDVIVSTIQQAITIGFLVKDNQVRKLVAQLNTIPSQPQAYLRIVEELKKPEPSTDKVAAIVAQDGSMTAKILQLVNSAFFGLPRKVIDPAQAVVLLGLDTIRDLTLSIGVFSQFNPYKLERLSLSNLWYHCQRTAGLSKTIVTFSNGTKDQINNAFIAGLLHDVGKLILADNLPSQYLEVNRKSVLENREFNHVEQKIFGTTHAQVGAYLLGLWGLSASIVNAVAGHHDPINVPVEDLPVLVAVHVANVLDHQLHESEPFVGRPPQYNISFLATVGVDEKLEAWYQNALLKRDAEEK